MTAQAFTTIALVMSFCIMWGMVFSIVFNKRYLKRLKTPKNADTGAPGFGDSAMTAMFIGLVSAYIGSYIGGLVSGGSDGLLSFTGSWMPLAVAVIAGAVMAVFIWLAEKKRAAWVESFSIAGSMLIAMAAAVVLNGFIK